MGCINSKEIKEDVEKELSLSSQISFSELSYMEPIKTKEQKQIEKIQKIFREEYKNKNVLYR